MYIVCFQYIIEHVRRMCRGYPNLSQSIQINLYQSRLPTKIRM